NTGPLVRSLESCENYYAAFGETWERLALMKARGVAGDSELAYEFSQRLQPFIYPRSLSAQVLDEIYQIKKRIEQEILDAGEMDRHVKLGRGGIREIEFTVQALQLLHGSRQPFLQEASTLRSLEALGHLDLLARDQVRGLREAYVFLRRVEHRLQMRYDLQTHLLPPNWEVAGSLHESLGFKSPEAFVSELKRRQKMVRGVFEHLLESGGSGKSAQGAAALVEWPEKATPETFAELRSLGIADPEEAFTTLDVLARGPHYAHTAPRTRKLFARLWPNLRQELPKRARPDLCLKQLERFIEAYGARSTLFEIVLRRPKLLEILFLIFDNSRYLTDTIIRHPEFIEDIALTGTLDHRKRPEDVQRDIRQWLKTGATLERVLRLTKRSELLRIELRAMMGKADLPTTMAEWSELAEVCLDEGWRFLGGEPDFAVIGMGKFGGKELSNGSDLDVMFVGSEPRTATRLIKLMTETTEDGIVFPMDARLRPYGSDGLLTLGIEGYRQYYAKVARPWERLALTRARGVAGGKEPRVRFAEIVAEAIYQKPPPREELAEFFEMRRRIETERSGAPVEGVNADYKTGAGGLVDLEFMAQISQLLRGWKDEAWRNTSTVEVLKLGGWKGLPENYLFLRNVEFALRRFHLTEESSLPKEPEERLVLARHLGFADFAAFAQPYGAILQQNRAAYQKFVASVLKD
ncbi:MAG: hypothetical protein JO317_01620, partial [Verrucomicrobiae bacterium]|nr:hypothetical protein [Verrucomicrobiae bacterium]